MKIPPQNSRACFSEFFYTSASQYYAAVYNIDLNDITREGISMVIELNN